MNDRPALPSDDRSLLVATELTYAKAGGPPEDWMEIEVLDADTLRPKRDVVEVNTAEGWARVYRMEEGRPVIDGDELVIDKIAGRFAIMRRRPRG